MKKITVEICLGTTCYVMGASELQSIEEHVAPELLERLDIRGTTCLGCCKDRKYGKAPYVRLNGEIIAGATLESVLARIEELTAAN